MFEYTFACAVEEPKSAVSALVLLRHFAERLHRQRGDG